MSVSVRRNGTQLSTAAAGEVSFTILDKRPVVWRAEASNLGGSSSEEITVRPVTFGSWAAFITSGWSAPAGCGSASWS